MAWTEHATARAGDCLRSGHPYGHHARLPGYQPSGRGLRARLWAGGRQRGLHSIQMDCGKQLPQAFSVHQVLPHAGRRLLLPRSCKVGGGVGPVRPMHSRHPHSAARAADGLLRIAQGPIEGARRAGRGRGVDASRTSHCTCSACTCSPRTEPARWPMRTCMLTARSGRRLRRRPSVRPLPEHSWRKGYARSRSCRPRRLVSQSVSQ